MQRIITLLVLTTISNFVFGQTNYEKFKKLYKDNDTTRINNLLTEWEKSNPNDPELYTSAFNYYFANSKQEIISLEKEQRSKESFQLTDTTGAVAGYINANLGYNPDKLNKSFDYINKGIQKFPNRLDIRFGKCYVLGQIKDYEKYTTEIINAIEYSNTNKNNWQWTESKKLDDAENFMLGSIQEYLKQLYDTEDDNLLENIKRIGDVVMKYYHNNIEILSTTAVANMLTKNYDKALVYLKQRKVKPKRFYCLK